MSVVELARKPTASEEAKADCINILRKALALAESGDMTTLIIIAQRPDNSWSDERSTAVNFPDAIGRLEIVKQSWITSYIKE